MKRIVLIFTLVLVSFLTNAQPYETSAGARLGWENGFTIKHFLSDNGAIEGIVSSPWRWGGIVVTGLYEFQSEIPEVDGLFWYAGGGGHVGFYNTGGVLTTNRTYTYFGVDGIVGVEFVIPDIPINVSLDWKPGFNINGGGFYGTSFALSGRYIF